MPHTSTRPLNTKTLLSDLQKLVRKLEDDLRERSTTDSDVQGRLRSEWDQERAAGHTASTYETWRDDYLTQVAVAWILACVFVRWMEDNDFLTEVFLAGEDQRMKRAHDTHDQYVNTHPTDSDKDYLLHVFATVAKLPACEDLLSQAHNPLWRVAISADAGKLLLGFWQATNPDTQELLRVFESSDTRFLGDLYQDLSEAARKKYALLQTPDFVEEFILDRTLEPAIQEFGLEQVRMIDPTCGSGHFVLGAFQRLLGHWGRTAPGMSATARVIRSLEAVAGVDLNPFAVAIARFRLLVAALAACGVRRMKDAPDFHMNLATGDSLLHGRRFDRTGQYTFDKEQEHWLPDAFAAGDFEQATKILSRQYHVVVGNPPSITEKDEAHREYVRKQYDSCYQKFSLAVPFTERFFDLARYGDGNGEAGFVGMITANSFMKREFGKKLIESYLSEVDLTHVIDTSGAYIPGHGTPTVVLFGRHRPPQVRTIRAVMGIRGEPGTPSVPAAGEVWQAILGQLD
ncbi:MAG TPA: BREX-2 system adenine-specific DNA-methyltransferase PglX, partial [Candidatus Xenobia bacterium]